jgi:hypothetical protein
MSFLLRQISQELIADSSSGKAVDELCLYFGPSYLPLPARVLSDGQELYELLANRATQAEQKFGRLLDFANGGQDLVGDEDEVRRKLFERSQLFAKYFGCGRNDPCACGANKKFKHCCHPRVNSPAWRRCSAVYTAVPAPTSK